MTGRQAQGGAMALLDDWAVWMRAAGRSEKTIGTRTRAIRALCASQGLDDPATVTEGQLTGWLAGCRTGWTRCTYWASAHAWCSWLVTQSVRSDDPLAGIPRPPSPHNAPRPVPMHVVRLVIVRPRSMRARAYVVLAAFAGLRVHEIAKLRGEDVDMAAGWLYVVGKGADRGAVPLHMLVAALAEGMPRHGWWFPSRTAVGHVTAENVSQVIQLSLRAHGSSATAHALRHTFGTYVLRASGNIRLTQEAMRHRSVSSTQVYTQVSAAELQAAVRAVDWAAA